MRSVMTPSPLPRPRIGGFSLLEVLIALVVLSVGLLGLAALQAAGLRGSSSAFQRSQAVVLASDIADRMRVNRQGLSYFEDGSPVAQTEGADNDCNDHTDGSDEVAAAACSAVEMAAQAVFDWGASMPPGYAGTITAVAGAANRFTISVTWTDRSAPGTQRYETDVQL